MRPHTHEDLQTLGPASACTARAAGDLIDGPMEMFKARRAGVCAARNIMGQTDYTFDYSDYPDFMHTTYEVTWTGLSEDEARAKYKHVTVIQMPPKGIDPKDTGLPATDGSMFFGFLRPGLNGITTASRSCTVCGLVRRT